MYSLVYVSTAAKLYTDEDLDDILRVSRSWNRKVNITGLLLYKEGYFMQFLEGPKGEVLDLLTKIKADSRHHSMIVIFQKDQGEREFDNWSMGFDRLGPGNEPPPGFTDLWELPFNSEQFLADPTRALQLLFSFKVTVR
jgi:hypothetical protein